MVPKFIPNYVLQLNVVAERIIRVLVECARRVLDHSSCTRRVKAKFFLQHLYAGSVQSVLQIKIICHTKSEKASGKDQFYSIIMRYDVKTISLQV